MKIELISLNEETGEAEFDIDDEGREYLIELGLTAYLMMRLKEEAENEKNR